MGYTISVKLKPTTYQRVLDFSKEHLRPWRNLLKAEIEYLTEEEMSLLDPCCS